MDELLIAFVVMLLGLLFLMSQRGDERRPGEDEAGAAARVARAPEPARAPAPPLSPAALALQERLGLAARELVSVAVEGVVLDIKRNGATLTAGAAEAVRALGALCDVVLVARVDGDAQQARVADALARAGVITSSGAGAAGAAGGAVAAHKLLFCTTDIGHVAVVRQLRPALHVYARGPVLEQLAPHVPRLVEVAVSNRELDSGKPKTWRLTKSLEEYVAKG